MRDVKATERRNMGGSESSMSSLLETAPEPPLSVEDAKAKSEAECLPLSAKGMCTCRSGEDMGKSRV